MSETKQAKFLINNFLLNVEPQIDLLKKTTIKIINLVYTDYKITEYDIEYLEKIIRDYTPYLLNKNILKFILSNFLEYLYSKNLNIIKKIFNFDPLNVFKNLSKDLTIKDGDLFEIKINDFFYTFKVEIIKKILSL